MTRVLLDSSTLFDLQRAVKRPGAPWAQTCLANLALYRKHHDKLTISGLTVFEYLEGLYLTGDSAAIAGFYQNLLPRYEVIQPTIEIEAKAAEIHATLRHTCQTIDAPDTLIAATAIVHDLPLVNANTRHFPRVTAAGFPLRLDNWRD